MFTAGDYIAVELGNLTIGHSGAGASWAIDELRERLGGAPRVEVR